MSLWKTVSLGEVVGTVQTINPCSLFEHTFRYIDISAINQELKSVVEPKTVMSTLAPSRARQLVHTGDILVSTVRPNLNGVARVPESLDEAIASTGFCVLRPRDTLIDGAYLFHWVKTTPFITDMVGKATGASYPAVSDRIVLESQIPVPSLTEQRRIAAVLDMAEALRVRRRAALVALDELTRAIFLEMFGDPVTNPKGWKRGQLGELLARIESGNSPNCLGRPVVGEEWGVLKLGAVTWCEYNPLENKALPPGLIPDPALEVRAGDLLFSRKNTHELVAACALVHETPPRLLLPDLIFRFRFKEDAPVDSCYLYHLLINPRKRREIQKLASGSAGSMPNISKARLHIIDVELPPLNLQRTFASRVASVTALKKVHLSSLAELDQLFASFQHRAFRGEL